MFDMQGSKDWHKNCPLLTGRVVVVTGGAGLIGRSIVKNLAVAGAVVVVADVDFERAYKLELELSASGGLVVPVELDIASEESVDNLIRKVEAEYGTIYGWVNNAYPRTGDWHEDFESIPLDSWRRNVDMHLNGYFLCCQKAAKHMKKNNFGSIVNMASIYGLRGPRFNVYEGTTMTMPAAYAAIKGGVISLTRYLASYYGSYNLRFNCVAPGGVLDRQPAAFLNNYTRQVPMKRLAEPDDVSGAVVFLLSDLSKYITGHVLAVDGGWTAC
ncbi:MAG: oxidoreductase [Negativicutes bacterium]|nr:oxidoreductase [Negativicutes bacterium]